MHEVVKVGQVRGIWSSVPVSDSQLTEQSIGSLPALLKVSRKLASLDNPGKEQL